MIGRDTETGADRTFPSGVAQWADNDGSPARETAAQAPLDFPDLAGGSGDEATNGYGLYAQFARDWLTANPNVTILFVPLAEGGTALFDDTWDPDAASPVHYNNAVTQLNAVFADAATGEIFQYRGTLWLQGESDAGASVSQVNYAAALERVIDGLVSSVSGISSTSPFVVVEIRDSLSGSTAINAALNALPTTKAYTAVVEASTLASHDGGTHYSKASVDTIGTRCVAAIATAAANAPGLPGAPTGLSLTPGDAQIGLSWSAPVNTGLQALTDYVIERSTSGGAFVVVADGVGTGTTFTDTSLTNGLEYTYRVSAVNATGQGNASSTSAETPVAAPEAPSQVTGLTVGNGTSEELDLSWTAPASNGSAITGYLIERSTGGAFSTVEASHGSTSYTDTGLTNGTEYTYRVSAINGIGTGTASATVAETAGAVPSAITDLATSVSDGEVVLTWSAPAANGFAITDYVITRQIGGSGGFSTISDGVSATTGYTDSGLTNDVLHEYTVAAVNAIGTGTADTASGTPTAVVNATITQFDNADDEVDATDFTFASMTVGSGGTVIVGVAARGNGANTAEPDAVTVAGSSATLIGSQPLGGNNTDMVSMWRVSGIAAGSASVFVDFTTASGAANMDRIGVVMWTLENADGSTAAFQGDTDPSDADMSVTIDAPEGGVLLGLHKLINTVNTPTSTWTGLTQRLAFVDADDGTGGYWYGAADEEFVSSDAGRTVSATGFAANTSNQNFIVVSVDNA